MTDQPEGRPVLIGYDPERGGDRAVDLGVALAGAIGTTPHVIAVRQWPPYQSHIDDVRAELEEQLARPFARLQERHANAGLTTQAIAGPSPASALYDEAERRQARLVVVGSSHRGPVGRTLAGSAAESLLNGAACPVVIVPRPPGGDGPSGPAEPVAHALKKIAVAYNGSPESRDALDTAVALAAHTGASLTLIAVADYPSYAYGTAWPTMSPSQILEGEQRQKEQLVKDALSELPDGIESHSLVATGDTATALAEQSEGYDLLVTGSRGYGPLRRTLLGSVTRRVVRSSSCPVLVVPRGVGSDPLGIGAGGAPSGPAD